MKKNIRQAHLPRGAYDPEFRHTLVPVANYGQMQVKNGKKVCECHVTKFYDPMKHRGCYDCFQAGFHCCDKREQEARNEKFI